MIQYAFQKTTAHSEHGSDGADGTERFGVFVADEQDQSQSPLLVIDFRALSVCVYIYICV